MKTTGEELKKSLKALERGSLTSLERLLVDVSVQLIDENSKYKAVIHEANKLSLQI